MRRLSIIGEINEKNLKTFSDELSALEAENDNNITVELHSDGGNPMVGLAFSSRIRTSPCNIIIEAHGLVGSSAVIILAAGDHRRMAKECWLYLHEASDKVKGKISDIETVAKQCRQLEDQWNMLLEFYTKVSKARWDELHKKDVYIPSDDCVVLGIVEEVF